VFAGQALATHGHNAAERRRHGVDRQCIRGARQEGSDALDILGGQD
jgi:hypothetical protein